jgi:hypothetical protein
MIQNTMIIERILMIDIYLFTTGIRKNLVLYFSISVFLIFTLGSLMTQKRLLKNLEH